MSLEQFFYGTPITVDDLREMLLRAACSDTSDATMAPVVKALIQAYLAMVDRDSEKEGFREVEMLGYDEANTYLQKQWAKKLGRPAEDVILEDIESLPEQALPKFLVATVSALHISNEIEYMKTLLEMAKNESRVSKV